MNNRRLVRGVSILEVVLTCVLMAAMGALLTAGWKGGRETRRDSITLSAMHESTRALLVYSQDYDGYLPHSDSEVRMTLGVAPDGAGMAMNVCLTDLPAANEMELLVLTAPIGKFVTNQGKTFRPARVNMTDSYSALAVTARPNWSIFEPQDSKHMGAAPYGLANGGVKVWHPAAFRPGPVHKDQCNTSLLMGTPDNPSFIPDSKLDAYLRVITS